MKAKYARVDSEATEKKEEKGINYANTCTEHLPVKRYWSMKYICNGRIPGSTSGYPSDQDRAFKSDAVKGYRAADTAVSLNTPLQVDVVFVRVSGHVSKIHP